MHKADAKVVVTLVCACVIALNNEPTLLPILLVTLVLYRRAVTA